MKSITSILSMIAASAALLVAQGTTHTWTNLNTGSTLYWNVDANWDATFPNAAGAEAIVAGNFTTADAVIRLGDHITVGSLTIGDDAFDIHEAVFGARPVAVSICGTSGKDGPRLTGFDETEKSRQELDMLAELGVRRINTFLSTHAEDRDFCDYAAVGHPEIAGFPSGFSDTNWMLDKTPDWKWRRREPFADAVQAVIGEIRRRGAAGVHMPIMLHDWAAWTLTPDRELDHVKRFAEAARAAGFDLVTHESACSRKL